MVKGVSRQVIVVRPREEKLFDQAIFLLKEGAEGVSDEQLLTQARKAANRYLRTQPPQPRAWRRLIYAGYATLGAAVASTGWLLWMLVW